MMTITARLAASLVSVLATAAIATAPVAGATANAPSCRSSGGAQVCQKQGHSSMHAKPTPRGVSAGVFASPWLPGYGRGHMPPLLALD